MKLIKFLKDHSSFLFTLSLVLGAIYTIYIIFFNALYRDLILVNAPYLLTITCLSLIPIVLLKKLAWYPEAAPLYAWTLLILFIGYYYSFTHGPNLIRFGIDLVTSKMTADLAFSTIFGLMTISGVYLFFYLLMAYLSAKVEDTFSIIVDPKSYAIWSVTYLIYLNALISIVNPVFRHPF